MKWYMRHKERLAVEKAIMNSKFPQFVLKVGPQGTIFWEGILKTNFGTYYHVSLEYPEAFPYRHLDARIIEPPIPRGTPHLYVNGTLCVYPENWDPARCTALASIPLIAEWLARYEIWRRTGESW